MKLTKDGADVCEVGLVLIGPPHTEVLPAILGKLGGTEITEPTYTVTCAVRVNITGGRYRLIDDNFEAIIRPFGYATEEGQDHLGNPAHIMRFTALWPKGAAV